MSLSDEFVLNVNTETALDTILSCESISRATGEAQDYQIPRYMANQQNKQIEKVNISLPNHKPVSRVKEISHGLFTRNLIRCSLARLRKLNSALASGVINVRLLMVHRILDRFRNDLLESRIVVNIRKEFAFVVRSRQKNPLNERNVRLYRRLKLFRARIHIESSRSMQILKEWEKCVAPTSECVSLGSRNGSVLHIHGSDSQNALVTCVQIHKELLSAVVSLDTLNAKCKILSCRVIMSRFSN